jgi:hypothetical protein
MVGAGAIAAYVFRIIGLPGVVALGMLIFYEGLPLGPIRYIPYVGTTLAGFVDGRVDRERQLAKDAIIAESRAAAMAALEERSKDNAEISTFDKRQLCVELGGRWVEIPAPAHCD